MKFIKKYLQSKKIKKIKKERASIDWSMQFDDLNEDEIYANNRRIALLQTLLLIEEAVYESYCS